MISAGRNSQSSKWSAPAVALGFAVLFLALRSQQYMAVDGALRCLHVFYHPAEHFHGNNHMLYPFWIWLWSQASALAGMQARDWLAFLRESQAMNGLACAAAIGLLCSTLQSIAGTRFALLGAAQFGLATAVVLHGTNSAEPVMGLLFCLAAGCVLVWALNAESQLGLLVVGALLALAMASYQAMALAAPAVAFACVAWPAAAASPSWRTATPRLLAVGLGGLISVAAIYGLAYSAMGVPARRMVARFLTLDGGPEVYGGFKPTKIVNFPFGLVRNLYGGVPDNYGGIRALLRDPHRLFWIATLLLGLALLAVLAFLIGDGIVAAVRRSKLAGPLAWAGILLSLLGVGFPLFFWSPLYDKLWLLPLAAGIVTTAFAYRFSPTADRRTAILAGVIALLLVEAATNIPRAVRDHVRETAHLSEARDLAAVVQPDDSVVLDFDDVSMLWLTIWGDNSHSIVLPSSSRGEAARWFARSGQRLLFVGVLDQDRASWDAFLGRATGIAFTEMDCYRQRASIVRSYPFPGGPITVRSLNPDDLRHCGLLRAQLSGTPETR